MLYTDRLQLRVIKEEDLKKIHELHSIPEVDKYNALGIPTNIQVTEFVVDEWLESIRLRREYVYAIEKDSSFIGLIAIRIGNSKYKIATVWYKINPEFWGKGYATEALMGILNFGFEELNLHRIEAGCAVNNLGSIRVLEKVGMIREGNKRKVLPLKSGWSDNYEYAILDEDWYKTKD
ncbi:GNAT family N-acetyltransferase [Aquimarina sp. MMG016]|uniref:GNAT family N-acetyltransferase n=1 Tax=Aquimarina sp. MMG016 TaxID=2822690 RepID=UPI001B3A5607|nr:GNAT family N-acetyltransferase [Aquimarina sp. MMG016]MBQ4821600.1 GNAT family N-acetyltransferase [Aquimarina sp. MMG016]